MEKESLLQMIEKYLSGRISVDEIKQLDNWYESIGSQTKDCVCKPPELENTLAKGFADLKQKLGIG